MATRLYFEWLRTRIGRGAADLRNLNMSEFTNYGAEKTTTSEAPANRAPDFVTRVTSNENSTSLTVSSATRPEKDKWDKIAAVAPIISGIFIFLAGGVFTFSYNQQQLKVQEIQTIEKFIPHLTGSEQSKKAAILAINSLADAKLAGRIASIYASQGTVSALQTMTKTGNDKDREIAEQALAKTVESLRVRESRLDDMESEYKKVIQDGDSSEIDTPVNLIGMAVTYKTNGQYALSEQLLKRALTLVEKKNGAESAEAAHIWRKLAELNTARGNRAQSESCQKRAIAIEAKILPTQSAQEATSPENSSSLPQPEKEADATPKPTEG
ncbi:MAG: hypothetical protein C0469_07620 [Cyanobacteria bacterium DS2.3.42]|nr:hypothetical protein [Cyanobacteria bacterium DS2.3.42]